MNNGAYAEIILQCPNKSDCGAVFVSTNKGNGLTFPSNGPVFKGTIIGKDFSPIIKEVSSSFVTIYNQAYAAEQQSLLEICGVGYRKAIEFLIKDFSALNNPDEIDKILKMPLMQCINSFVKNENVKKVAERAVWLGNDETHYVKLWENHDMQDLKKLIDLTVHWIEAEQLTKDIIDSMPRK